MTDWMAIVALGTGVAGMIGAMANAVVQFVHCRRDKREFKKRPPG
jgi:ABC-type tungstate transport system permease subunit